MYIYTYIYIYIYIYIYTWDRTFVTHVIILHTSSVRKSFLILSLCTFMPIPNTPSTHEWWVYSHYTYEYMCNICSDTPHQHYNTALSLSLSLYIYLHLHPTYVCHISACVCGICTYTATYMCPHTTRRTHICAATYMCGHIYVRPHICAATYMCLCMCICWHIYVAYYTSHTHTHIHNLQIAPPIHYRVTKMHGMPYLYRSFSAK